MSEYQSSQEALTFIGLGNIGRGLCKNLILRDGLRRPISIYNRTPAKARLLVADLPDASPQVSVYEQLEHAIKGSTIVFCCLSDDAAVNELLAKLLQLDIKGVLFVDCSTVHPETTSNTETRLKDAGAMFVAMPVFGAPAMADAGMLIPVLAGPAHLVERVKPFTVGVIAKALIDMPNEDPAQASKLKLTGNSMIMGMVESIAQGLVAAEKNGVGPQNLHRFIDHMWGGAYSAYSNRMLSGDYYKREPPLFAAPLAIKDINHARSIAGQDTELPTLDMALRHLEYVKQHAKERGDLAGIYGAIRALSGLPFENDA